MFTQLSQIFAVTVSPGENAPGCDAGMSLSLTWKSFENAAMVRAVSVLLLIVNTSILQVPAHGASRGQRLHNHTLQVYVRTLPVRFSRLPEHATTPFEELGPPSATLVNYLFVRFGAIWGILAGVCTWVMG